MKKLIITLALIFPFISASAIAQTYKSPTEIMIERTNQILRETEPLVRDLQQQQAEYNEYVYTHLYQACVNGDQTACAEQECRHNDILLRQELAADAIRNGHPPITVKHNCGLVRYRF